MDKFLFIEAFNQIEERFKNLSPQFGEVLLANNEILEAGELSGEVLRVPIEFGTKFNNIPKVIVGFNTLDVSVDGHFRVKLETANVTCNGMEILVHRWFTTIHQVKIFWIAFPANQ